MLVEINRLNFEHYQIKFWTERKPGESNPHRGNLRSWQGPKSCPECNVPIATGRDRVASHTTLVQADWWALYQSTLPALASFFYGFSRS